MDDRNRLAIFAAELGGDVLAIELHGKKVYEALEKLEQGFDKALRHGDRVIKIIHGKGTGTLEKVVKDWLVQKQKEGKISVFQFGTSSVDAGAVIYAVLAE